MVNSNFLFLWLLCHSLLAVVRCVALIHGFGTESQCGRTLFLVIVIPVVGMVWLSVFVEHSGNGTQCHRFTEKRKR